VEVLADIISENRFASPRYQNVLCDDIRKDGRSIGVTDYQPLMASVSPGEVESIFKGLCRDLNARHFSRSLPGTLRQSVM
jgi:hypothetical protein